MKKTLLSLAIAFSFSSAANADTYDPATNRLIIPSITVEGITYTDVVITVGEIISIGGSSSQNNNERTCSWTVNSDNEYNNIKYELSVLPSHRAIRVSLTGLTNFSTFHVNLVSLVQGINSINLSFNPYGSEAFWQGDYGYDSGPIPLGVIKGGVVSKLPTWLDLNKPFKWVEHGRENICS